MVPCRYRLSFALLVIAVMWSSHPSAQAAQTALPAPAPGGQPVFEVASVKPNKWGVLNASFQWTPTGLTITNYTLFRLIESAYAVQDFHIAEAPGWLMTDRFDVTAKAAEPLPSFFTAFEEQLGLRLESQKGPTEVIVIEHAEQPTPD